MRKQLIILIIIVLGGVKAQAQKTADLGLMTGLGFYWGDVRNVNYLKSLSPSFGVFARWNMNKRMAVKAQLMITSLNVEGVYPNGYTDSFGTYYGFLAQPQTGILYSNNSQTYIYPADPTQRFTFHRSVQLLEGLFEFNFKDYQLGNKKLNFTPYISTGIGLLYSRANGSGTLILNQQPRIPRSGNYYYKAYTDGNGHKTNELDAFSPVIPVGMGIKWNISDIFAINVEAMVRKTFTDNIDNLDDPVRFHYFDDSMVTDPVTGGTTYAGYADKFSSSAWHNNDWVSTFTVSFIIMLWDGKGICPVYDK